jgi:hypothetical protein
MYARRIVSALFPMTLLAIALTSGSGVNAQAPAATPTFSKDVAPILNQHCVSCHRPGDIAPMSLQSYTDARPYVSSIRRKVSEGTMPPWHAEAPVGTFKNDRRLTAAEKNTIVAWATNGAPEGNPKDLPPAPTFATGWSIGKPDVVLTMTKAYDVPAAGEVPYQYFEIPTNFTEDKWVQAIEIRPGALSVVHHILAFASEPGAPRRAPAYIPRAIGAPAALPAANGNGAAAPAGAALAAAVQARQAAASGGAAAQAATAANPNAPRPLATGNRGALIATTAPGTNAMVFEPGQALLVRAGAVISFQIHYTATGKATSDKSSIGFIFAKEPPKQEVQTNAFVNALFAIPAGAASHEVDSAIEFTADSHVLALFPHTHLRGKDWEYRLVYPDGRSEVVLAVPHYDFNWQTYYEFTKPLAVPKGARLEARAHYDNSTGNKANPDPNVVVRWGEQTWEEMQYTGITFIVDDAKPAASGQQQ